MIKKTGDTLYIGVDETNHGRFPEIFIAVASFNYQDSLICPTPKRIRNEKQLLSSLKIRDYRYTIVLKEHYEYYGGQNIISQVSSKLIQGLNIPSDFLKLFIDGDVRKNQRMLLENLIQENAKIPIQSVLVRQVPKGKGEKKKTNYLISLADGWANWVHKRIKQNKITKGMEKRKIEFE